MSLDLTTQRSGSRPHPGTDGGSTDRRQRRRVTRDLARLDRASVRLAELHGIRHLLTAAGAMVSSGWVQHGWFSVADEHGRARTVDAHHLHLLDDALVAGGCLVGAVVHAAGGPTTVRSQLVQRTLDLLWHALHEDAREPVRWCPAPSVRMAHVRDLTRWNDAPRRTADQAVALLGSAVAVADAEVERLRASTVGLVTA